jgi:Tfp pilus assembly protein PilX
MRPLSPLSLRPLTPNRQGFALIITIILMAFLVLLMVSFSALTRVEVQIATNSQQAERARQNAMTALNIALGQLQAAAGPDQRVTARAEILDGTPSTSALTGVNQPHWTGVWKTGSAGLDIVNSGTAQRETSLGSLTPSLAEKSTAATWLISNATPSTVVDPRTATLSIRDTLTGADLLAANQSGVTTAAAGANPTAVMLAKNIGRKDPAVARNDTAADSSNPGYIVAAPLVDLNATVPGVASPTPIGRYAYWVSDEGIKAKVNIKDPTLKTDSSGAVQVGAVTNDAGINTLAQNQLHFIAPQSVAAHKILPDTLATDFRGAADYRQNPKIDQVLTPQQLPLLPSVAPTGYVGNRYLADITTYSYGVLADVRNGGLRKDLTAAMEDLGATSNKNYAKLNPDGRARVYRVAAQSTDTPVTTSADLSVDAVPNTYTVTRPLDGLRWLDLYDYYNLYKKSPPVCHPILLAHEPKPRPL